MSETLATTPEVAAIIATLPNAATLKAKMCDPKRNSLKNLHQARKTLRILTDRYGDSAKTCVVYRCPFCGNFHVGRQMKGKRLGKLLSGDEVYTLAQLDAMDAEIRAETALRTYAHRCQVRDYQEQRAIRRAPKGERRDYVFATYAWEDDGGAVV